MAYNYNLTQNNPWLGFAQENPQAMYNAFLPNQSDNFLNYFQNKYSDVYGKYWGKLGQQALSGQAPTLNFEDYLSQYPFMQQWYSLNPSQRGERTPSSLRWNV